MIVQNDSLGQQDQSLSRQVYTVIRQRIIEGVYAPGSRLRERELSDEFAVSRVPLREALPQLESEGFIQLSPRRGAVVTEWSMRDVHELLDLRLALEPYATRCAAENVGKGASMDELASTMDETTRMFDAGQALDNRNLVIPAINAKFHLEVVELSGSRLMHSVMTSLMGRVHWLFRLTWSNDPVGGCSEHRNLCDAIRSGNGKLAEAIAFAHIEGGRAQTVELLRHLLPG